MHNEQGQLNDLFASDAVLFVEPSAFRTWQAAAARRAPALESHDGLRAAMDEYRRRTLTPRTVGQAAVIDICGPIVYHASWQSAYFGASAIEELRVRLQLAVDDPAVRTIVLCIDSPGGEVTMVPEFADEIRAAAQMKPIVAVADTLIASAAYWLAAQASTICASPSARVGSIGVYTEHVDVSGALAKNGVVVTQIAHGARKLDGNQYEPLPDDVRARIQARVDAVGREFEAAVAAGRRTTPKAVAEGFGQGDVFRGAEAIARGLADLPLTFAEAIGSLQYGRALPGRRTSRGGAVAASTLATVLAALEE